MLDFSAVRDLPVCSDGWDLLSRSSGRESFSYCWVSVFECTVCLLCLMLFAARYRDLSCRPTRFRQSITPLAD